jgi:hypothetical protein
VNQVLKIEAPLWVKGGLIVLGLGIAFLAVWIANHREGATTDVEHMDDYAVTSTAVTPAPSSSVEA